MRSITQTIVLDRLQQALASRGIDLKRSAVLEIAAESFGFQDGNAFVAAMKEGRFDPPEATPAATFQIEGRELTVLRDPASPSFYALDLASLPDTTRKARFVVSPYGGMASVGSLDAPLPRILPTVPVVPASGLAEVTFVVERGGHSTDAEVDAWRHLLDNDRDIEVECHPVGCVDVWADRMARIDGKLFFVFTFGEEYASHGAGISAARDYAAYVEARARYFERLGGSMRWEDDTDYGRVEVTAFLPVKAAQHVDDIQDWQDAVAILLGADHEAVIAHFNPQTWVNDNAMDVDALGDDDFDVTAEILLMGSTAAQAMRDNSSESDDFMYACMAPDWVHDWNGPFYIEVADNIAEFLEGRALRKEDASDDDDWSCDNCGEAAQDGSGVCITCGHDSNVPDDSVCDDCGELIDYDTGICTGCGRDHTEADAGPAGIDAGVLKAVLPDDADHLLRQTDANDPV